MLVSCAFTLSLRKRVGRGSVFSLSLWERVG